MQETEETTTDFSFNDLAINSDLHRAIEKQNFDKPTPIQEQAIPIILDGKDLLGIAKTGTGKTAAYVLPLVSRLASMPRGKHRHVRALILVPTRELAVQVQEVIHSFTSVLPDPIKSLALYGGVSINPQMKKLMGVDIAIATPGRLLDLIDCNALSLDHLSMFVIDEADKVLSLGFRKEVDEIIGLLPAKRQNLLFSATLNKNIKQIKRVMLSEPEVVKISENEFDLELINQYGYFVAEKKKKPLLRYLVRNSEYKQILVFVASKERADDVAANLNNKGIKALSIHGKKSMEARFDNLMDFRNADVRVLVTTDLLTRGIDIECLPCVINFDLPRSPKDFVHRIGRTGRADQKGDAIVFVDPAEEPHFYLIQKRMKKRVPLHNISSFKLKD